MKKINKCRACASTKLERFLSLGNLHLSKFIKRNSYIKSDKYPLNLLVCGECSLVQLDYTVKPTLLYNDNYGYLSGINHTMKAELKDVVTTCRRLVKLNMGDKVIDIGSNDGTLLKNYPDYVLKVGFDLVRRFKEFYNKKNFKFINNNFRSGNLKAKIITAISMFYDLNSPGNFLDEVKKTLTDDGIFVIQQNYLFGMVRDLAFDNIVHEHLAYYSLGSLEKLLKKHGLEIFDVIENDINGGSFRTYIQKTGGRHLATPRVINMRKRELGIKLDNFPIKIKKSVRKIKKFIIKETKKNKTIYVYGASTRGNTLLQFAGLTNKYIKYAVERNPEKFGKKIGSVNIPIISEKEARKLKPDYMLVLPWYFRDEIIKRESLYLKSGGKLIFPLPKLEVI